MICHAAIIAGSKAKPLSLRCAAYLVGPPGVEPGTNGLCVPATAFAAPFGFVVWTVSCLYDPPVQSLHLPGKAWFGSGLPECMRTGGFPEFERFYSGRFRPGTRLQVCCVYRFRHVRMRFVVPQRALERESEVGPSRAASWLLAGS